MIPRLPNADADRDTDRTGEAVGAWRRIAERRALERGLTITEVMVVLVIAIVLIGILTPAVSNIFMLEQRQAAKELALLYEQLHDEAIMRNVTFRVAYDLRANTYEVQVAEAGALIFDDPQAKADFEEEFERQLSRMSEEDRAAELRDRKRFQTLGARFKTQFELPSNTVIGGVYTPQYGEMIHPDQIDEDEDHVLFSYIFPNGQAEHTVVWLTEPDDDDEGFTVEIEPLSGSVHFSGELKDWDDTYDWVPDEGPDLQAL